MRHDITGLNKAAVLVALYDNAKNSNWTKATISNIPFLAAQKLELNTEKAQQLLAANSRIDYIGAVLIKIDFSGNTIDTSSYDKDHHGNGGAKLAVTVISAMRAGYVASLKHK